MDKARGVSSASRVNLPELLSRVDNDRELLLDLLAIFKEDFPRHVQALRDAVTLEDTKQVAMVSHTLKGMLSNMAVAKAAEAAAELEQLANAGTKALIPRSWEAFVTEVQGLVPEMETHMAEVPR